MPGNPYDGHTLAEILPEMDSLIGNVTARVVTDAGYRGHNAPRPFQVYVAGQKRGLSPAIKRAFKRRAAIEPVIGYLKQDHRMGRNHLAHRQGDAINAILAAVGYNFRRILAWIADLLRLLLECPLPEKILPIA